MGLFARFKKASVASRTAQPEAAPMQDDTATPLSAAPDTTALTKRRASWFKRSSAAESGAKEKGQSISDSGPYIWAFNPATGKEGLQKNPHWPNEDSWKREQTSGWAMGSMYGKETRNMG